MAKVAAYIRISTRQQNGAMQEKAIREWAKAKGHEVKFYRDKFTGKTMDRPGWTRLETAMRKGQAKVIVIWKLDRLGRTVSEMSPLFKDLVARGVRLVSLTEGFDLSTAMGKLLAHILASFAEYETEIRGERVAAGQALAKKNGKTWGGSRAGWTKLSSKQRDSIVKLHDAGTSKRTIAETMGLSWPTVSKIINAHEAGVELRQRS